MPTALLLLLESDHSRWIARSTDSAIRETELDRVVFSDSLCPCRSPLTSTDRWTRRPTPFSKTSSSPKPIPIPMVSYRRKRHRIFEAFPLGCPISGTMFLRGHAETNYCLVRQVLRHGNIELGVTSNSSEYFRRCFDSNDDSLCIDVRPSTAE